MEFLEMRMLFDASWPDAHAKPFSIDVTQNQSQQLHSSAFLAAFQDDKHINTLQELVFSSLPAHGTLTLGSTLVLSSHVYTLADIDGMSFTPTDGYSGPDTFNWEAETSGTFTLPAAITISITSPTSPHVDDGTMAVSSIHTTHFTASDFSKFFTDPVTSNQMTGIQFVTLPDHGILLNGTNSVTTGQAITLADISNLEYTPAGPYDTDSFTWIASDNSNSISNSAKLTLTIPNEAPSVDNATKNVSKTISTAFASSDFIQSFHGTFKHVDLVSIDIMTLPSVGTLTFNGTAATAGQRIDIADLPKLKYTPPTAGTLTTSTFTWEAWDGYMDSAAADLTMTLGNTVPVLSEVVVPTSLYQNKTMKLTQDMFLLGWSDPDQNDHLVKVKMVTQTTYGTLTLNGIPVKTDQTILASDLGKLKYRANPLFSGYDHIYWLGSDGTDYASSNGVITIKVLGAAPKAGAFTRGILENTVTAAGTAFNAWDFIDAFTEPNAGPTLKAIQIATLPQHGKLLLNGSEVAATNKITLGTTNGTTSDIVDQIAMLTYVPDIGFVGTDTFTWAGSDGMKFSSNTAKVTLTVLSAALPTVSGNGEIITPNNPTSRENFTDFGPVSDFPNISGEQYTRTYVVKNNSTTSMTLHPVTIADYGDYHVTTNFPDGTHGTSLKTLAAGESASFVITFSSVAPGHAPGKVSVPTSAGTVTFNLSGTGIDTHDWYYESTLWGLQWSTEKKGSGGTYANAGDVLAMNYTGYKMDGTRFDSSLNVGREPFMFSAGAKQVITGWDPGLLTNAIFRGIQIGEKRLLIVAPTLAYAQDSGHPLQTSTLIFEVQCLGVGLPRVGVQATGATDPITPGKATSVAQGTDFGLLGPTQSSITKTFSVPNVGYSSPSGASSSLSRTESLTGPNASDFVLTTSTTGTFTVTFNKPNSTTPRYCDVVVNSNDKTYPVFKFRIKAGAEPYVDLTAKIGTTDLPAPTFSASATDDHSSLTVPVTITNKGTIASTGTSDIEIWYYNTGTSGVSQARLQTFTGLNMAIAAGASKTYLLKVENLPAGFDAGSNTVYAQVNLSGGVAEPQESHSNNTSLFSSAITALPDLTGELVSTTVPAKIVADTQLKGSLTLTVTNSSSVPMSATQSLAIQILALNTATTTNTPTTLGTVTTSVAKLAAGASKTVTLPFNYTVGLDAGTYMLEAQLTPTPTLTEVSASNNLVTVTHLAKSLTLTSVNPFYDFKPSGTMTLSSAPILSGDGTLLKVPVVIQNLGNVATPKGAKGNASVYVANTSGAMSDNTFVTITGLNYGSLAPNAKRTLTLTASLPIGIPTASYKLGVTLSSSAPIADTNTSNNSTILSNAFQINDGLPDLYGTISSSTLLPYIVTAATASGTVTLTMANKGNVKLPLNQKVDIQIVAHSNNTVNGDIQIGSITGYNVSSMAKNAVKTISIPVLVPASLPADNYILEAKITAQGNMPESNMSNNTITLDNAGHQITLNSTASFFNLAGTLVSSTVPSGKPTGTTLTGAVNVTISNVSNTVIPSGTTIQLTLTAVKTVADSTVDVTLGTASASIALLGIGKSTATIAVPVNMTKTFQTAGTYALKVQITAPTLIESSTADNFITLTASGGSLSLTAA